MNETVVVSVEHGGNDVPAPLTELFEGTEEVRASHRGWDPGSLALGQALARRLEAPLIASTVTRLLVDLNRSPWHRHVFSEITRPLPRPMRDELIERYHTPHRTRVADTVADAIAPGRPVIHVGVHSFTPVFRGVVRKPDVALLYDPRRTREAELARAWLRELAVLEPTRELARNNPYRGNADGLTTTLRARHDESAYIGIEIEVNQKHVDGNGRFPEWVTDALWTSLLGALGWTRSA